MWSKFATALQARAPGIVDRVALGGAGPHGPEALAKRRNACSEDIANHIEFLLSALEFQCPALFVDYTDWQHIACRSHGVPTSSLIASYQALRDAIVSLSDLAASAPAAAIVEQAIAHLSSGAAPSAPPATPMWGDPEEAARLSPRYLELLMAGQRAQASELILSAVDGGIGVEDVYLKVLAPALWEAGRLWQTGKLSVAQEHYISVATQVLIARLYPKLPAAPRNGHVLLAACVTPNLHDIGLRFVCDLFDLRGWDSHYLGGNTPGTELYGMALRMRPDIVAISACVATDLKPAAEFVGRLRDAPEIRSTPVIAGGRVFVAHVDLWKQIGADGFARDALSAVELAQQILESR